MSIFILLNKIIRVFKFVRDYQGEDLEKSTIEHIASGVVYGLIITLLAIRFSVWILFLNLIVWILYAPFKEYILDRKKQDEQTSKMVLAQVLERSLGFVIQTPFMLFCLT